jgi:hypothetical protein
VIPRFKQVTSPSGAGPSQHHEAFILVDARVLLLGQAGQACALRRVGPQSQVQILICRLLNPGSFQQPNKSRLAAVFGKDVQISPELSHIRCLSPEILRDPTGSIALLLTFSSDRFQ